MTAQFTLPTSDALNINSAWLIVKASSERLSQQRIYSGCHRLHLDNKRAQMQGHKVYPDYVFDVTTV